MAFTVSTISAGEGKNGKGTEHGEEEKGEEENDNDSNDEEVEEGSGEGERRGLKEFSIFHNGQSHGDTGDECISYHLYAPALPVSMLIRCLSHFLSPVYQHDCTIISAILALCGALVVYNAAVTAAPAHHKPVLMVRNRQMTGFTSRSCVLWMLSEYTEICIDLCWDLLHLCRAHTQ